MNKISQFIILTIFIFIVGSLHSQEKTTGFPKLKGPYFGQKAPIKKAELFMDGIISTKSDPEMCAAFSLDGKEFFFNNEFNGYWAIFFTKVVNGFWTKPEPLPFTSDFTDRDFTISPDGTNIYFGSNRPKEKGQTAQRNLDIFVTKRDQSGHWSKPKNVGSVVNTNGGENYPSVARNGNLYFFSNRSDGFGGCDIYISRFLKNSYQQPENLGPAINSSQNDWDSFIVPDESYIIFSSQNRSDTNGRQDLYISFRDKQGNWTRAQNMGAKVNSSSGEICPSVSLDGKYFFFTSRRRGKADIFWINAKIIEDIKSKIKTNGR